MMKLVRAFAAVAMLGLATATPAFAQSDTVTVFAAASLKDVLDAAGKAFTAAGGPPVTFSFAASSALAKQIEGGAPADLFASADTKWMDYLADKKLIQTDTRVDLLGNSLVVIAPATSALSTLAFTPEAFGAAIGDSKLATGEVKSVPVGRYAQAALQKLGLWAVVEPKLAQTENVRAALAFVARGEAALGIVYGTDALVEKAVKVVATFPADSHDPIIYPFAVTSGAKGDAAAKFLAFLKGPDGRAIFEKAGFPILAPK